MWAEPITAPAANVRRRAKTHVAWASSVDRAIAYMRGHLDEPCSLEALASAAGSSRFHFIRLFREMTGTPPAQYLSALRLQTAKRLLLTTDARVTDICLDVGYNSLGTFIRRFKAKVGLSPRELRQAHRSLEGAALMLLRTRLCTPGLAATPGASGMPVEVTAPRGFDGMIFVGVFRTLVADELPLCCGALAHPGSISLPQCGAGCWVLAAGIPWATSSADMLAEDPPLRARAEAVEGRLHLCLQPSTAYAPPILPAFPALLARRFRRADVPALNAA
jgi:AraC-like DNA-binding protein